MITSGLPFSGFSVDDTDRAAAFYREVLGLRVDADGAMLHLQLDENAGVLVYPKGPAHVPATYTVLNFPVADIDAAVAELTSRGVVFERYPEMAEATDAAGVVRSPHGPPIAWFTDPAGNIFSVVQET
mgnify:CR=1 FL=1